MRGIEFLQIRNRMSGSNQEASKMDYLKPSQEEDRKRLDSKNIKMTSLTL